MSLGAAIRSRRGYLLVSAAVVAADLATKTWAHASLRGAPPVDVIPGFLKLIYSRNPGGLFGILGDAPAAWRVGLLTVLPVAAIGLILLLLLRGDDTTRVARCALALILGGAVGNLIDRVVRGEVVDFIDAYVSSPELARRFVGWFGTAHWPTFNLADSAIVVGAGLLAIDLLRPAPRPRAEHD